MKRRALTLLEVLLVITLTLVLIIIFLPSLGSHECAPRSACASNLKQIYTGMVLYSQDYNGVFPLIDLKEGKIVGEDAIIRNRVILGVDNAFKDIPATEGRSISQNLWLLIRSDFVQTDIFNCQCSEQRGRKCNMRDVKDNKGGVGPEYFVDFPFEKIGTTISYSFVQPWSVFGKDKDAKKWFWSADIDPRLVIGADTNNSKQPNYAAKPWPPQSDDLEDYINSTNHNQIDRSSGQNAVFGDGHVTFEKSAYVGVNKDNIYTAQPKDYKGEAGQTPGVLSVRPKDQFDTVLIPNREEDLKNWDRQP